MANARTQQAKTALQQQKSNGEVSATTLAKQTIQGLLEKSKGAIAQALPKHMNSERLLRVSLTAINTTPALLNCYPPTLVGSIIQASQLGLEPNTPLGHAYLVPFRNNKKQRMDVQLIIGYKGLIDLARRSGHITSISAHAVRADDEFEFAYGLHEKLHHVPNFNEEEPITHFYAVAHFKDGGHAFVVLSRQAVDTVMKKSQSHGDYGPWKDYYEEMGCKTAIRKLAKFLPLSVEFARAIELDGKADAGQDQHLDNVISGEFSQVDDHEHQDGQQEHVDQQTGEVLPRDEQPPLDDDFVRGMERAESALEE